MDLAKASSTARRSSGLSLFDRYRLFGSTRKTLGPTRSKRTAVEADVVGAHAGLQAGGVEDVGVEAVDLEEQRAGRLVPVEREEALELLHAGRLLLDRGRLGGGRGPRLTAALGGGARPGQADQRQRQEEHEGRANSRRAIIEQHGNLLERDEREKSKST